MSQWTDFVGKLRLPVISAPMFLISSAEMVIEAGRAGIVGSFPAPNARTVEVLDEWCAQIVSALDGTPWAINLLMHSSYARFADEAEIIRRWKPDIVVSAVGSPERIVDIVHGYGGIVLADVASPSHARKALTAGADGLVILCAGAGGHTGTYNPFAFVAEVRRFWQGPLVLSGGIADARGIAAARMLGADLAYMGTRFLACTESLGGDQRKELVVGASMEDIILSSAITGVPANWIRQSLTAAGMTSEMLATKRTVNFTNVDTAKPWKNIWGAGHGVGSVGQVETMREIIDQLASDYHALTGVSALADTFRDPAKETV